MSSMVLGEVLLELVLGPLGAPLWGGPSNCATNAFFGGFFVA